MSATKDDIKAAFGFAARIALVAAVPFDDLVTMLRTEYEAAKAVGVPKDVSKGVKLESVGVGYFVTYIHNRSELSAHVLEVKAKGALKIRAHMGTSNQDLDVDDVPYSPKPKKGHWSYR